MRGPWRGEEAIPAARRCSGCGADLRAHEAPERFCDGCLRAQQVQLPIPFAGVEPEEPGFPAVEPLAHDEYEEAMREANPDLEPEPPPEEPPVEEYGAVLWPTENGHDEEKDDQIVRDLLEGVDW